MNDQNIDTNVNSIEDSSGQPVADFGVGVGRLDGGPEALSLDPSVLEQTVPEQGVAKSLTPRWSVTKLFKRVDVIVVLVLVVSMVALLIGTLTRHEKQKNPSASVASNYDTQQIPLKGFVITQQSLNFTPSDVKINGSLTVSAGLVIAPSVQPNTPTAGQLYFDHNTDELAYFNGTGYVALTGQGAVVQSIGGVTGSISLGGGLSVVNNQLTAAFPTGVSSIGGISGAVTVGNGLKLVGSDIQNSGVISLAPGTPNLVVGTDGSGNLTISSVGGGSGTVTSGGGTAGRIAKFTGVQNVEDSLLSEAGTTVTANGNLSVTGSLALGTVLSVANGGTGANNLPADGVVIGQGTGSLAGVTAASPGLCLVSTVGAPAFQSCSGSTGVNSVNGLTGALTIANATGSVNTITIDDASTSAKGIASFNGTNFTVTSGAVNTAQNITTASTPTFAGVNTNTITPSSTLTIGASTQSLNLLGSASSLFSVTGGGQTTSVGFTGSPTGAVTYLFDRAAAAGTYNICTTAANCSGIGGSVTTSGGTTNRLSKFTAGQTIGDSSISDNGTVVTVNGTANLVVQGGTATLGTLTQAGTLSISDGTSHTVSIVASGLSADRVYTLPDAGGNATLCVNSGNCIGGTGAAPNAAEYLVASLNGTLTNERALTGGSNISLTDGGANGNFTVATVQNPTFTTSVTTPVLQSSGALTITSAAGNTVAIDAGTTIELQDSTNVTGSLDVSAAFTSGTANAFQVNAAGAIAAATGITSSGTVTFSSLNCTSNLNGGALTTNGSGQLVCSDDDGGSSSAITGSGAAGTVPLFNGAQTITNSIITQAGTTITVAGDLTLNTALSVANGGTGTNTLNARGLLYGNGASAVQVTAAGTGGQVLIANGSGVPVFASFTGDVAVSNTGATTIQADSVALGTDTTGNYVANLGSLTGLTTSGNTGEGSTPTLSVTYGAIANTAVQGNITLTCPSGAGNLTGGGNSVTLGSGGSCNNISTVNNPSFTTSVTTPLMILTGAGSNGTIQVANLGQGTVYTLPDPGGAAAAICISTGNCSAAGAAGGDLTGTYPNPTIAKLQGTNLTITSPAAGHVLVYNGTTGAWENHALTGDIAISETGVTAVQANAVALGTDTTGNYVLGLTAGNGVSITGSAGEGWSPTVTVLYGSTANTAVQGNTSITVTAGTNLSGGGAITLGAGGTVTLNVASSPTFSGTLTVQGATATIGTSSQQGSVVLNDGSSNTGTVQTAALGQNTTYTLPDPGAGTTTICLSTGNCAGAGSGVTTTGGTINRVSKFTGSQALGDSTISDDGSVVTINGTANFVVQGGTGTLGTLTQAGTLAISDGSSNTVSIVASGLAADRVYTLPDAGGAATFCLSTGNCIGGGGGGAPNNATYLLASLDGTLTNDRALANGSNIAFTDAGANGNFTVATVQNPTFTTSVTTPVLQSSGALTISSAAGTTVAIDAGTTIELQDSTNVTGSLDVSAAFTAGTANAFQVNSSGAITAATGITSSGTVTFSGLNCTTFANGGALTTNASGQLQCSNDDGGAGGAVSGSGTSGTLPIFTGTNTIADSIVTQASTTITIAGDLVLNTALSVANGGTGTNTLTTRGLLYGNGTGAVQVTAAGTGGQVLIANVSGVPTFASFTGDVAVSNTGVTTIQADSVALGTDTIGNYVSLLGTLTGLTTTGNTGEGSTPTLSVTYGFGANTAVQGNTSLTCPAGSGNLSGGGNSITLGTGGSCGAISTVNNPSFTTSVTTPSLILTGAGSNGTLQVANLGQATTYTLPDPGGATASICLNTGNCTAIGTAGGDLTGSYPNPTIAKLQSGTLTISSVASGNMLQYNGSAWVNQSISGDITLNSSAVATIGVGKVTSGNIFDGTIANVDLSTGSFGNITGVGTLGALTVVGATSVNTSGTANTAIGNATGTFQVASNTLNISTAGALTGVTGITTSGGYTQSGVTANTLTGATTLSAAGTALSVTNNATIGGTLTANTISPNTALTVGVAGQSFTLQGNGTSTIKSTDTGNTTTVGFVTPTANTTLNFPALAAGGPYTICTNSGNCGGVGVTLQTAYTNSTNPEIVLDATRGALTVRDTSGGLAANLFEVQNNTGSTTYFNVTASGINTTGTETASGNINSTGGTIQTNTIDRISNGGNLVNIGTITTSGAINTQTISSAANFTGTLTIQGANALTLGTASSNTGAIIFKGSGGAGTLTLNGPTTPNVGNFALTIPAITANANVCTDNVVCTGYAPASGSGSYATKALDNLASVAINAALGFQSNQTANINFAASAATTGNALNITGQTAGATGNNGGDITIQGGLGTTTGTGGTTAVRGGNAAATGTNGTLTLDAGTGATVANGTINIGAANASTINVGTNNTLTSTIQIGATAQSAGTQTINIGNSNTAGGTTNVVIGSGTTAAAGSTTIRAKGVLGLTAGAASTWDVNGTLSLQTTNNAAITTGTGLWTQGGNLTFNGTTARTITGPATGGLTVNTTTGPLTLSTTTSGILAVTSAGALNLSGAAASTLNVGANTLAVTSSNFNVTAGGALTAISSTLTGTGALTLGTASTNTGSILFKGSGGAGTLTLAAPTTPNVGNFTLTIPAIGANANVCTDDSLCAGYAPASGSGSYANTALSNLSGVAINTALGFQANQAANINFAAAAAAAGNSLSITGQTAGGAANNGGDFTIQGGTGTTTGIGGTTTVRGGNAAATGTNGTLTLDAGSGASTANGTINIGNANASAVNVGVNNTLTSTVQIGATAQSAGTQTINIGNSNTAGGTTNVVIGAGTTAAGGTTTVRSKGSLSLTGGAASTWDVNGTLSLQTTNNGAITTGTGLWTQGGNLTFNGTTARTITGPATGGLTVNTTTGPLTLSTTTSGALAVTSAGALNLTGAAASTLNIGANTLAVTSSNYNVTAGGAVTAVSDTLTGANALTLGTASSNTGAILFKGSGGAGTLTLAGPTIPNVGNFTLTIPAITANANVCTDNAVCTGYAPVTGSTSYATRALDNLASVSINAALGFQSNQTANINFNGAAATDGNLLQITGQTAGATAHNGGAITIQAGTGTTTGIGGTLSLLGGVPAGASGTNGSVTIDTGNVAGAATGTIGIGSSNFAHTINIGNGTAADAINIGTGGTGTDTIAFGNSGTATTTTFTQGSGNLTANLAGTGDFVIQDAGTPVATFADDGSITFTPTSSADFILNQAAGSNFQITASAVPTVSQVVVDNTATSGVVTTDLAGVAANFKGGAAAVEGAAIQGTITPGTTSGGIWSALRATPNATGAVSGVIEIGLKVDDLTSPGAGSERAINVGTGWDIVLQSANTQLLQTGDFNTNGTIRTGSQALGVNGKISLATTNGGITSSTITVSSSQAVNIDYTLPTGIPIAGQCLAATAVSAPAVTLGYAACSGGGGASTSLNNLASVAINTDLQFQQGGTRTINIAQSSSAGNQLSIAAGAGASGANNGGNLLLQGGARGTSGTAGSVIVQANGSDSTTAFQVQNSAGQSLFTADTTNSAISLFNGSGLEPTLTSWTAATALPTAREGTSVVVANGYMYVLGGATGNATSTNEVRYMKMNASGALVGGTWGTANTLPASTYRGGAFYANGYIYYVGGYDLAGGTASTAISYAKVNADGSLGSWQTGTVMPNARSSFGLTYANGYVYVVGGYDGTSTVSTIYMAKINSDGSVGAWDTATSAINGGSPVTRYRPGVIAANGFFYVIGGGVDISTSGANAATRNIYYATINPTTGALTSWTTLTNALPAARNLAGAVTANGYAYLLGGTDGTPTNQTTIYTGKINSDGTMGTWASTGTLPNTVNDATPVVFNGYVYYVGGSSAVYSATKVPVNNIYYASTPRLQVNGSVDLVGLQAGDLTNGGDPSTGTVGGSITAGNGTFVGALTVQGAATFNNDMTVTGNLTVDSILAVDSKKEIITIGPAAGDTTGALLVLGNKTNAGDPTYVAGAMYYNSSSGVFRCAQGGSWTNCVGVSTSDTYRQQPFFSTDFFSIDNTPANAGYSEQEAPWLGAWANGAGQMGVVTAGVTNHPGIIRMSSAGVANTGWMFETGVSAILLSGGESFEAVFRTPSTFSNTTIRMGFMDTITSADATDGAYVEFAPGTTTTSVTGKTANNSTRSSTGTTGTVTVSLFYRIKITVNSNASTITYALYNDGGTTPIWTNTLSANIPTTAGRETASGVIATNSVGAAALLDMDYMAMWLSQSMTR